MSGIIWGIIDFNKKNNNIITYGINMMNCMEKYKIDKYDYIYEEGIFLGCGLQYITEESLNEVLPLQDDNLLLTCDAIIDNRKELLNELGIKDKRIEDFTDSQYILLAYKKWKEDCVNYLEGDFAFAILDKKTHELFCTTDHVGKRTLYYYFKGNKLIFSTLIKPILENIEIKEFNEQWLAENLAVPGVLSCVHFNETMYKYIYQMPPATYMTVKNGKINFNKYWNPERNIKILHLNSEEEYIEKFKKVFSKAVIRRTRCLNDVGILLSSGLDSTAVAAYAAPYLDKRNKKLKSFTSVPLSKNKNLKIKGRSIDETYGVKLMAEKYNNISPEFCDFKGESTLTSYVKKCSLLEMPYKAIENIYWYLNTAAQASERNCKVLLDGQYGNLTISFGECTAKLLTSIRSGDLFGFIKEMKFLKNKYKLKLKELIRFTLKLILPYSLRKKRFERKNGNYDKYNLSLINNDLMLKYNIDKILDDNNINIYLEKYFSWNEIRKLIVNPIMFSHVSEYETKTGLMYGILKRDPTRDKNLIELILSFSIDQFFKNGEGRLLVRRAMKGMVPDDILNGNLVRGIQAADWVERLRNDWEEISISISDMIHDSITGYYFNLDKLKGYYNKFKDLPKEYSDLDKCKLRSLISAFIFYKYICNFNKKYCIDQLAYISSAN